VPASLRPARGAGDGVDQARGPCVGAAEIVRGSLRTERGWDLLERRLAQKKEHADLLRRVRMYREVWQVAAAQVGKLEQQLRELIAGLPQQDREAAARLEQVPGIGPIVAATILAAIFDASRFQSSKHVVSYAGLAPTTWQSGDRDVHGHITHRGSSELRAMLCEAAHHCVRPTHPLHPFFVKLCARRGHKIAVVACAAKILRIAWRLMLDRVDFDPGKLGVEEGPFEERKVRHWRVRERGAKAGRAIAKAIGG
jgi:transposase